MSMSAPQREGGRSAMRGVLAVCWSERDSCATGWDQDDERHGQGRRPDAPCFDTSKIREAVTASTIGRAGSGRRWSSCSAEPVFRYVSLRLFCVLENYTSGL